MTTLIHSDRDCEIHRVYREERQVPANGQGFSELLARFTCDWIVVGLPEGLFLAYDNQRMRGYTYLETGEDDFMLRVEVLIPLLAGRQVDQHRVVQVFHRPRSRENMLVSFVRVGNLAHRELGSLFLSLRLKEGRNGIELVRILAVSLQGLLRSGESESGQSKLMFV